MSIKHKKKPYKRIALALSLCAILIWSILGTGASLAWFTDTSEDVTNIFHIADFELEVSHRLDDGTWETIDGKTVLFIGEGCFSGCDILTTVILPGSVVRIEEAAFYRCTSLRGVFIPAHVTSVGAGAFAECDALEAVCFAAAPLEIGDSAFDACDTLHFIFFPGSYEQWKRLYQEDISPSTYICCSDGIFPQSD